MKTKLFGRMTLLAFVLMVTLSFGLLSPMLLTLASGVTTITGGQSQDGYYIIELTNYKSSYDYDDLTNYTVDGQSVRGFVLPTATVKLSSSSNVAGVSPGTEGADGDYTLTTTVRNSSGVEVPVSQVDESDTQIISVSQSDTYYITYTATSNTNDISTATRDIQINITTKDAVMEFDTNSAQIIPTVVQAEDKIVFPWPQIKLGDDEPFSANNDVTITLEGADGEYRTLQDETINGVSYKTYTVQDINTDNGTFTVRYSYNNAGSMIYQRYTFNVVSSRPEVALAINGWSGSGVENLSLSVGQEATLPTPTIVNTLANNATVSGVYTEITITNNTTNQTYGPITNYTFTPPEAGNYTIEYNIRDFTGATTHFTIHKNYVRLTGNSITVKVVEPYSVENVENLDIDEMVNADYDIPSTVFKLTNQDVTVNFPAIFAKGGWGDYDNLKLTRTIYRNNSLLATLENRTNTSVDPQRNFLPNEVASYTFENAGTYTIRYEAHYVKDDGSEINGTTKQLPSYTFVIEEVNSTSEMETTLTVTAPTVAKSARKGSTITFNAPVATDYKVDTTTVVDSNLKIEVVYQYRAASGLVGPELTAVLENNTYSITLDEPEGMDDGVWETVAGLTITFKATNDSIPGRDPQSTTATATADVTIVDFSSDIVAPALSAMTFDGANENGEISLPTVTFTDQTDLRLVAYVIKNNKVVNVINATTGTTATITAESYTPTEEGEYIITFVATDQNNNTSTISIKYSVDFNNGYSVTISGISAQEYGTVINLLDYIQVTDAGRNIEMQSLDVVITNKEVTEDSEIFTGLTNNQLLIEVLGAYTLPASDRLEGEIVTLEGDITVRAWAKDDAGICDFVQNGSARVSFTSEDSTNPAFTIAEEDLDGRNFSWDDTTPANNTYELPWFSTTSDTGSGINFDSMQVELTYADETDAFETFTIEDLNDEDRLEFSASKQGKINAVYSVSDNMGNTYSRTFVLNIGDVTPPEIVLADDAVTCDSEINGTLTIDLSKVTIGNDTDINTDDIEISITRDGTAIEYSRSETNDNIIEITLDTAGTYVVTFDVTDTAGNDATQVVRTFTVAAEPGSSTTTTTIWGTVLIIVALIVLGVVVFFFVKPSKTKTSANIKIKKDDNKGKETKKDESTK